MPFEYKTVLLTRPKRSRRLRCCLGVLLACDLSLMLISNRLKIHLAYIKVNKNF